MQSTHKTANIDPISRSPISDYLAEYPAESTMRAYRSHLYSFLDFLNGPQRAGRNCSPDESARYEILAAELLHQPKPVEVLPRYVVSLASSPPTTAAQRFAVVIDWLAFHDHEPGPRERKVLSRRLPKGGPQTMEGDLDHDILSTIVQQLDLRGRAIVLVLASSGMRIGEALQITTKDLVLSTTPAEIQVRGKYTKTGAPRTVFISSEAAAAVREWLKIRDAREDLAYTRATATGKKPRDNRLFPYSSKAIQTAWIIAIRKAGLLNVDPTTNRTTLHLHMLRKFFHSQMKLGCPEEVVESLMGHGGYLSGAYRRYTKRELAEHYERAEMHVTVVVPEGYRAIKEQAAEQIDTQRGIIDGLTAKSLTMENRIDQLEAQTREQNRIIETLIDIERAREQE